MSNETEKKKENSLIVNGEEIICTLGQNDRAYYSKLINELKNDDGNKILFVAFNKLGDIVIATLRNHVIYLFNKSYNTIMYAPKLMFHLCDATHLHIDDVLEKHHSVGNGSILMQALLLYAHANGFKKITGNLSSVDDDHKTRRDNFYKKFGFEIQPGFVLKNL